MDQNQPPLNGKKAILEEELIRGRDMANQLLEVLADNNDKSSIHHHVGDSSYKEEKSILPYAEDLVRKVLRSFTNTLLLLNTSTNDFSLSTMSNCTKVEGSVDETCKSFTTKSRRGCYKRKSSAPTWEKDSSILCEDGHAWRKYGQKKTMNSKYLRSYYRCTYKNEQGCQAIKQVQRIQDEPPLYRTTYYGHHTCNNSLNPEIKLEPASSFESSTLLSFGSSNNTLPNKQAQPISSSTKEETGEIFHDHNQGHSSNDIHLLLPDYELYFDY